jgi:nucleoside-diphosphate-sugar epimerase
MFSQTRLIADNPGGIGWRLATHFVYNVTSFTRPTRKLRYHHQAFPRTHHFEVDPRRQKIVDSWPEDVDDSAARRDWDWQPDYDQKRAFEEYLIPAIRQQYIGLANPS